MTLAARRTPACGSSAAVNGRRAAGARAASRANSSATSGGTVSSKKKSTPRASIARPTSSLPAGYASFLDGLKARIRTAQGVKAALSVNAELVLLYWSIGRDILARQEKEGWGAHVIDRLSADLHAAFRVPHLDVAAALTNPLKAEAAKACHYFGARERAHASHGLRASLRKVEVADIWGRGTHRADPRGKAPAPRASWRAPRPQLPLGWQRRLRGIGPRRACPRW